VPLKVVVAAPRDEDAVRLRRLVGAAFGGSAGPPKWTLTCRYLERWPLYYVTLTREGTLMGAFVRPERALAEQVRALAQQLGIGPLRRRTRPSPRPA
jgi:hypothetical protein